MLILVWAWISCCLNSQRLVFKLTNKAHLERLEPGPSRVWPSKLSLISPGAQPAGGGEIWGGVVASPGSAAGHSEAAGLVPICLSTPALLPNMLNPRELKGSYGVERIHSVAPRKKDRPEPPASPHFFWGSSCREPPEAPSHASWLHLCPCLCAPLRPFIHLFTLPSSHDRAPTVCWPLFWAQKR